MILKVLGDWTYKPEANDNKKMEITFKRLSGDEELKISRTDPDDLAAARFEATVVKIDNPFKLEMPDGKQRDMDVTDIHTIPELSELYFELIVAYSNRTQVNEENIKKSELPF